MTDIQDIKVYQQAQGLLSVELSPNKISNWNIRNKNGKWYLYRNERHRNGYKSFDVNLAKIIHNPSELNKAIYELIVLDDVKIRNHLQNTVGPDVKVDLSETGKDIIDAGKRLVKVNKLLKKILPVLENYHKDLDYWRAGDDVGSINYVTCGTPHCETIDQFESYFNTVKKITNQVKGAV